MITFGDNTLGVSTASTPEPLWMKSERYEYCEQFFKNQPTVSAGKKKFSRLNRLLSFFL